MRSPDEIAAEIEGLSPADLRVRALRQSGYIESLEQRLAAIAKALGVDLDDARALRARPGRANLKQRLLNLWQAGSNRHAAIVNGYPTDDHDKHRDAMVAELLRDLGYCQEGEG